MLAAFVSVIFKGMMGVPSALSGGDYREHLAVPLLVATSGYCKNDKHDKCY